MVAALWLAGCTILPHEPWRLPIDAKTGTVLPPADDDGKVLNLTEVQTEPELVGQRTWERYENFDLAHVELTDNGDAWHRQQVRDVLDQVRKQAFKTGATIVVYAHGWHHNARPKDENVHDFRSVLDSLSRQSGRGLYCSNEKPTERNTRLIGIYVGWRGEWTEHSIGKYLTFWTRKKAAHRAGGARDLQYRDRDPKVTPPSVAFLQDLHDIYTEANESRKPGEKRSFTTLTTVGHSMGGALLFSAVQWLHTHTPAGGPSFRVEASPSSVARRYQGIGDVTVLVNPAFEAKRYREFDRIVRETKDFSPEQAPVLMVVSSRLDGPNRWLFRIGRVFSTVIWPPNWVHPILSMNAIGFAPAYRTHELTPPAEECPTCKPPLEQLEVPLNKWYPSGINPGSTDPGDYKMAKPQHFGLQHEMALTHYREPVDENAPFMIVRANGEIINGHNDIFNSQFVTFLLQFTSATGRKNMLARCEAKEALIP